LSYQLFYKKLEQIALKQFPGLADIPPVAWQHLISPLEIRLSPQILSQAQAAIEALHNLSRRESYLKLLEPVAGISELRPRNESVLMAYDFHTSEEGECWLVEVNTNGAGYMFSHLMRMAHNQESDGLARLADSFSFELKLWGKSVAPPTIAISDEDIENQKMYAEFVMYRDWFRQLGWRAEFCEAHDMSINGANLSTPFAERVDLVYNRHTDFYFEAPHHRIFREILQSDIACVTPSPSEYWRLADKQRLITLSQPGFLKSIGATSLEIAALEKVLIPSFEKSGFASVEEIWSQRKHLFFKPKRSHGSKSVYRGESVSRKVFERLMQEDILIQHYRPAQKMPVEDERSVLSNWKFDLRFYVYADQIQLAVARIYQGQVTNFASPLGGFTLVHF
jgi:hypothetical protein